MYASQTVVCPGVQLERDQMLYDEWMNTQLYGEEITVYLNKESSVTRDSYNSISDKQVLTPTILKMKVYPIIFNPTKYQMEKAGIQEQVTAIITSPIKSWTDNSQDVFDIDAVRCEIILRGETYTLTDKSLQKQIADTFVAINLGIFRK